MSKKCPFNCIARDEIINDFCDKVFEQSGKKSWCSIIFAVLGFAFIMLAVTQYFSSDIRFVIIQFAAGLLIEIVAIVFLYRFNKARDAMIICLKKCQQHMLGICLCEKIKGKGKNNLKNRTLVQLSYKLFDI